MIRQTFKDKLDFDVYLGIQKVDMEKGYLTRSERDLIKKMLEKDYKPTIIKEEVKKTARPLVTNYNQLRIPCEPITKDDNLKEILRDLKDGLEVYGGLGISAPQIGILKKVSYIKVPTIVDKKLDFTEIILINPKIIEQSRPFIFKGEGCTSFPNLRVDTDRFVFITVVNQNEKLEEQTFLSQDLEGVCIAHETDHLNGITLLERKRRAK